MPVSDSPVSDSDDDDDHSQRSSSQVVLEEDPTGRYLKYDDVLFQAPFIEAFRGYDHEEGLDVAWYEFRRDYVRPNSESEALQQEAILAISHSNIMRIHRHWLSEDEDLFIYVTDYFASSGSLQKFVNSGTAASRRVKTVKSWSRQILEGVAYLHSHHPPICHGGISISTTYISANSGAIKLCSPLRAFLSRGRSEANASLATMAPELCGPTYDEKIDVYAFGMVMLEIITGRKPYTECSTQRELLNKLSLGCLPNILTRVRHPGARSFLQCCLRPAEQRASAAELLEHWFLVAAEGDTDTVEDALLRLSSGTLGASPECSPLSPRSMERSAIVHASPPRPQSAEEEAQRPATSTAFEVVKVAAAQSFRVLRLVARLTLGGMCKEIQLEFRLNDDTCKDIAEELVEEFAEEFPELRRCAVSDIIEKAILAADVQARGCCKERWESGQCFCSRSSIDHDDERCHAAEAVVDEVAVYKKLDGLVIRQEEELRRIAEIQQRHLEETQQAVAACAHLYRR